MLWYPRYVTACVLPFRVGWRAYDALRCGDGRVRDGGSRAGRVPAAELLPDERPDLRGVEVPDERDDRGVGPVVRAVEGRQVRLRQGAQGGLRAEHLPGVPGGVHGLAEGALRDAAGVVVRLPDALHGARLAEPELFGGEGGVLQDVGQSFEERAEVRAEARPADLHPEPAGVGGELRAHPVEQVREGGLVPGGGAGQQVPGDEIRESGGGVRVYSRPARTSALRLTVGVPVSRSSSTVRPFGRRYVSGSVTARLPAGGLGGR